MGTKHKTRSASGARASKRSPPFQILYEDADLIAIAKPAGLLSIATDTERQKTAYRIVSDYLLARYPRERVFIVHRLDRDTSGVLLFAKNAKMKHTLQENWDALVKTRGYTAIVEGRVESRSGTVRSWLKQSKSLMIYSSNRPGDGREAVTHYKTRAVNARCSWLDITLETGRKNQIRVHMHDLSHPVAGDKKYGAKSNPLGRLALHAHTLELLHPQTGTLLQLNTPPPEDFSRLFRKSDYIAP